MENRMGFMPGEKPGGRWAGVLTKVVILTALVLSTAAVLYLMKDYRDTQAETAMLEQQAAQISADNQKLIENINQLGSEESVRQIARDELGLVDPGVIVFEPQQ